LPGVSGVAIRALGINARGVVGGVANIGVGRRAIRWSPGGAAQDLGTLRGHTTSEAVGINMRGDIVSYSADAIGTRRATLWQSRGRIVDLGTLPGGDFSQAHQ
jgi:probable HAF family extracellular repeat protein